MDLDKIIILVIILGIPAIIFPLIITFLRTEKFRSRISDTLYKVTFLGRTMVLSKHFLIKMIVILFLYSWLEMFLPFPATLVLIFFTLMSLKIADAKKVDVSAISDSTEALLKKLKGMQSEIGDIREHIEGLDHHIITKQLELDEKEELRITLEKEIKEKSTEASNLLSLTEDQKQLVLDSAIDAITKESKGTFWLGLLFGFFINILASLTWTLLGNPGKEQILENINNITSWFN